ncbi:MAG: sulfatase-like hydrolase/transferase [Candidatus Undinarchaeales archaeon]
MKKKYNKIFLITIDALRKDFVNEENAPFLTNLGKKGINFENCFTAGPNTPPSFRALLGGVYPLQYGLRIQTPPKIEMVNEVLKRNKYYTIGIHSNPWLTSHFGYGRGFNVFETYSTGHRKSRRLGKELKTKIINIIGRDSRIYKILAKIYKKIIPTIDLFLPAKAPYIRCEKINSNAINALKNTNKEKIFCWTHYMEVHSPYYPKTKKVSDFKKKKTMKELRKIKTGGSASKKLIEDVKKLYRMEIKEIDSELKKYINGLLRKYGEEALFIITADHGEEFYEHGNFTHINFPYDELMKVPLIIYSKNIEEKVDKKMHSTIDLPSTILDFASVEKPPSYKGKNLFKNEREFVICQGIGRDYGSKWSWDILKGDYELDEFYPINCYRDKKYKLIYSEKGEELYNIEKDPEEKKKLSIKENSELVKKFKKRVKEETKTENTEKNIEELKNTDIEDKNEKDQNKEKIKERLKALGYI